MRACRLASRVAVAAAAMDQFHTEMARSMALTMAVFKNSPMIKIAEAARSAACLRRSCDY